VVLRARLDPPPGRDSLDLHWRARALEVWTGHGWQAANARMFPGMPPRTPPRLRGGAPPQLLTADLEAVAGFSEGVVLTPGGWPFSVEFQRPLSASGRQPRLFRNGAGDLFYQPVEIGDLHYVVHAFAEATPLLALKGRGREYPKSVAADLVVAELDPRVATLAQQLGGGKDPLDAAVAIEAYLSTRLAYTRELAGEVKDPIATFLFERKQGHCELFSSSMVLMLRTLGIPARNVTGYYGGKLTSAGYYAVRAGDAHSWVEVYFPGAGFVQFDPTPAGDRGSKLDTLWSRVVLLWDTVQQRWRALVVDYDLISQAQAVKRIGALISEAGKRLSGKAGTAPRLRMALTVVFALVALGLLVWALRRVRFARKPGARPLEADRKRALQLWQKARVRLRRAGIEVQPATTAHEVARRAPAAAELARAYLAARWGGAELSADRARALLRGLDENLVKQASGLRPQAAGLRPQASASPPSAEG
jgi:transglutaminase-like putative cysteine protease